MVPSHATGTLLLCSNSSSDLPSETLYIFEYDLLKGWIHSLFVSSVLCPSEMSLSPAGNQPLCWSVAILLESC